MLSLQFRNCIEIGRKKYIKQYYQTHTLFSIKAVKSVYSQNIFVHFYKLYYYSKPSENQTRKQMYRQVTANCSM